MSVLVIVLILSTPPFILLSVEGVLGGARELGVMLVKVSTFSNVKCMRGCRNGQEDFCENKMKMKVSLKYLFITNNTLRGSESKG